MRIHWSLPAPSSNNTKTLHIDNTRLSIQKSDWLYSLKPKMEKLYQFRRSVMSNSWQPHRLQHASLPSPSPTPGAYLSSYPLLRWCHPTMSSSVIPFSSHLQSFPASGSFPMSQFSGHQLSWHQLSCLTQETELPGSGKWLRCKAHLGECTHQELGHLSFSDLGRAKDACPTHRD